jgi:hypothetical protein
MISQNKPITAIVSPTTIKPIITVLICTRFLSPSIIRDCPALRQKKRPVGGHQLA